MDENSNKNVDKVIKQPIEIEMRTSFLNYAMSVIVSRALPDAKDGLKPVHRRILYAMSDLGMYHNKPFKKSARIVGEVLGKYHPHGDTAVYDSMVRMAQPWSLRYRLIDGQGNFGSIDGDRAAAMRYTEARLKKISEELLTDLDKETVAFKPNFDTSLKEPVVLPAKIPNLLINGSSGIAVGMATNVPPHNLNEVCTAVKYVIENPDCESLDLLSQISGPDFPTGGLIYGTRGIRNAYQYGRGKIDLRARTEIEVKNNDRKRIIIHEIPYMVNKSMLIKQIADLVKDKRITGISDLRDESDKKGMRIVIELKRDASPEILVNQLYKLSRMKVTFGVIMLALVDGQPKVLTLKEALTTFIGHRKEVVTKRTQYELRKAEKRAHILEGLIIALSNIDQIIKTIKSSQDAKSAKAQLITNYTLSEEQSQAILDMKLQKLTSLETNKIKEEHDGLMKIIEELKSILNDEERIFRIIKEEMDEMIQKYGDERRTEIMNVLEEDSDIDIEDLIENEEVIVTMTHSGYIKRVPISTYKQQRRGGKGVIGAGKKEEDFIENIFTATTHSHLLFFTNKGSVFWKKVYMIPEGSRQAKGKAIVNLLNLKENEKVKAIIPVTQFDDSHYIIAATKKGVVNKTSLSAFSRPRRTGIIGIVLDEDDDLINVKLTDGNEHIIVATRNGMAVRFSEKDVRPTGRVSRGVRGITLRDKDEVVDMVVASDEDSLLTVTTKGYGKRTITGDYRLINRGGVGVRNIKCTEKNGKVVGVKTVTGYEDIILISKNGIIIRIPSEQISQVGRNTQGVRLMRLKDSDSLMSLAITEKESEEEANEEIEENTNTQETENSEDNSEESKTTTDESSDNNE